MFSKAFIMIGLGCAIILTVFDAMTSYMGLRSFLPDTNHFIIKAAPIVLSGLALAMNATASQMIRRSQSSEDNEFGTAFLLFAFGVCVIYDGGSSWVGMMCLITNESDISAAVENASMIQFTAGTVIAALCCLGPFLTNVFADLNKQGGSILGG